MRPMASNMRFSEHFENMARKKGISIIYWSNLDELIALRNCDVIIDEIPNYFDSRGWAELTLDVRRWLTQGAKSGIELYCSAQDFAQVDIAFRRLVNHLYKITKIIGSPRPSATRPPVKRIWGVCSMTELDPNNFDETKQKFTSLSRIPSFFMISREDCEIFDTGQRIEKSKPLELKHTVRNCPDCGKLEIKHS